MFINNSPDNGKTPIELSVGGVDSREPVTRAVITDGTDKTLNPFTAATRLFLYMKSEDAQTDAAHTHTATKYALTYAEAAAAVSGKSPVTTAATQQLYWDDAHSRCSKLTVYAFAIANKQRGSMQIDKTSTIKFGPESGAQPKVDFRTTTINPTFDWAIGGGDNFCSQEIFDWGDVVFSNNIADNTTYSKPDGRMDFDWTPSSPTYRKFDKGDLIFYHALSKVTFHVVMGEGFTTTDFKFNTGTNIKLQGFNGSGTFDLAQGEFTSTATKTLNYIAPQNPSLKTDAVDHSKKYYEVYSYLVPGTNLKNSTESEALTLLVNNNKYLIPMKTLYDKILENTENQQDASTVKEAILAGGTSMKAGVNYLFTINIGKSKINNISATVADWETVTSEDIQPSNAYVNLSLKTDEGTSVNSSDPQVDLYRAKDPTEYTGNDYDIWAQYSWATGYTATGAKATLNQTSNNSVYNALDAASSTQWYWPDNNTFYHFRTVNKGLTVNSGTNDVVSIYSGPINDTYHTTDISKTFADGKFNDYLWGAPFKSEVASNTAYSSTYGFCNNATVANGQLYKAIGATLDNILLIQHHMMSDIYVDVETTTGTDAVDMSNTSVKLVRYAKEAKIQMGNGLITGHGNYDNGTGTSMTTDAHAASGSIPAYDFSYRVVPQSMTNSSNGADTTVGLEITTSDGNVYKILDLGKQKITGTDTKITEWIPGKKYYYKFVLSKTGITKISATVVDWVNVIAADDPVQIQ